MANPALIDELEKQFRDNPRRVFARLANEYRKAGDYMRAIEICHAHVPQQPGYISGHIVLGQALFDAGELDQAQQTFQTALALDPENLIALRQLGDIARSRRDYREARNWYTRLLEVDPQNEEIVAQLGEIALEEPGARNGDGPHASAEPEDETTDETTDETVEFARDLREDVAAEPVADVPELRLDEESVDEATSYIDVPFQDATTSVESLTIDMHTAPAVEDSSGGEAAAPASGQLESIPMEFFERAEPQRGSDAAEPVSNGDLDEDVSWVVAEGEGALDEAFILEDAVELDSTERLVAEDATGGVEPAEIAEIAAAGDFDLTFEAEEFDVPLRPHTGESLSVIAEEDPLAGVHTTHRSEPSPFGEPVEGALEPDESESAGEFEPLPVEELDAAASSVEAAAGFDSIGDEPPAGEQAPPSAMVYDLGEAETLVEQDTIEIAWSAPEAVAPATPEASPDPLLDEDFGWEPVRAEAPEPYGEEPASSAPELAEAQAPAAPELEEPQTEESGAATRETPRDSAAFKPDDYAAFEAVLEENDRAEPERDAEPAAEKERADEPAAERMPTAFVTETMAELYLKQGFRNEAIEVYRKLVAQAPGDEVFRARLEELEQGQPARAEESSASGTGHGEGASPLHRPAAAFFKALSSVPSPSAGVPSVPSVPAVPVPPRAAPSEAPRDEFGDWAEEALGHAGAVSDEDESAALALASGFAPEPPRTPATRAADGEMSLNDIFGAGSRSGRATPGSLDAFFTPEGEPARESADGENAEDLEAFNAWLEGLKK